MFLTHLNPLAREITIVLTIKFIVIMAASIFVFGHSHRPHIDTAAMAEHFLNETHVRK
jgi:predicted phosphodiesterase